MPTYTYIFYYALYKYNVIARKWSTLYKRYVIWECSITTINPNYVNLMFSPHKAHNVLGLRMYICMNMNFYEPYMREWVRTCFVEHHILSHTVERETSKNRTPSKIQHGDNIYSMPNGFMLSIDTRERKNICLSHPKKKLLISLPWWFAYNFNYKMNGSKFLEMYLIYSFSYSNQY